MSETLVQAFVLGNDGGVAESALRFTPDNRPIDLRETSHQRGHLVGRVAQKTRATVIDPLRHSAATEGS